MDISNEQVSGITVYRVRGELVADDGCDLELRVNEALDAEHARVVLDLEGVTYVSSSGIGLLVKLAAKANAQGGRLILSSPSPFVSGVFETTRLTRFFEIAPTTGQAVQIITAPRAI